MKHVEFLGLPGAGKSTLLKEARRSLEASPGSVVGIREAALQAVRQQGHDQLTRLVARFASPGGRIWKKSFMRSTDRFAALARYLSGNPLLMESVLAAQRSREGRDREPELVLSWILNFLASFQLAQEVSKDISWLLIDEGFCQRAIALFAHGFDGDDEVSLEAYVNAISLPDVVVVVDAPISVCEERLNTQGWTKRMVALDTADRHAFMVGASRCVELVATQVERRGARVVRLDGNSPVAGSRALIEEGLHF